MAGSLAARELDGVTLLAGLGQSLDRWLGLAGAALVNVRQGLPDGLGLSWNRHVVIEVPANEGDFESVLGKPDGSYGSIAAVTHRAGAAGGRSASSSTPRRHNSSAVQSVLEHDGPCRDPLSGFGCADLG